MLHQSSFFLQPSVFFYLCLTKLALQSSCLSLQSWEYKPALWRPALWRPAVNRVPEQPHEQLWDPSGPCFTPWFTGCSSSSSEDLTCPRCFSDCFDLFQCSIDCTSQKKALHVKRELQSPQNDSHSPDCYRVFQLKSLVWTFRWWLEPHFVAGTRCDVFKHLEHMMLFPQLESSSINMHRSESFILYAGSGRCQQTCLYLRSVS